MIKKLNAINSRADWTGGSSQHTKRNQKLHSSLLVLLLPAWVESTKSTAPDLKGEKKPYNSCWMALCAEHFTPWNSFTFAEAWLME